MGRRLGMGEVEGLENRLWNESERHKSELSEARARIAEVEGALRQAIDDLESTARPWWSAGDMTQALGNLRATLDGTDNDTRPAEPGEGGAKMDPVATLRASILPLDPAPQPIILPLAEFRADPARASRLASEHGTVVVQNPDGSTHSVLSVPRDDRPGPDALQPCPQWVVDRLRARAEEERAAANRSTPDGRAHIAFSHSATTLEGVISALETAAPVRPAATWREVVAWLREDRPDRSRVDAYEDSYAADAISREFGKREEGR
jgi:hypothetical protein